MSAPLELLAQRVPEVPLATTVSAVTMVLLEREVQLELLVRPELLVLLEREAFLEDPLVQLV